MMRSSNVLYAVSRLRFKDHGTRMKGCTLIINFITVSSKRAGLNRCGATEDDKRMSPVHRCKNDCLTDFLWKSTTELTAEGLYIGDKTIVVCAQHCCIRDLCSPTILVHKALTILASTIFHFYRYNNLTRPKRNEELRLSSSRRAWTIFFVDFGLLRLAL